MDLRRIRHFHVLSETLNFSRAAERLHIAQPALSVSIQKLETELGTRLFERTPNGVRLTASGEAALIEARRLIYHGEQLLRTVHDMAEGTGGRLRIGFVGSAIYGLLPSLIPDFREEYPAVELVLREATSARILEMLGEEALDVGIVRTPLLQAHAATLLTLQRDHFIAALPRAHRLATRSRLDLAELARDPFVMYRASEAAGLHAAAVAACDAAGFVPQVAQEATQIATVLALVGSGLGVALVPEIMRGQQEGALAYCELEAARDTAPTTLALAWHEGQESPAAQRFIEVTRARVARQCQTA